MKRLIQTLLATTLAFTLFACGSNTAGESADENDILLEDPKYEEPQPEEPKPEEPEPEQPKPEESRPEEPKPIEPSSFYQQHGTDPSWQEVLATDDLRPLETDTSKGVLGSTLTLDLEKIETGQYGSLPIDSAAKNYKLHTVGNSAIPAGQFHRWSRWYQEYGNTQIFRLFKDEENVRNTRQLAARVEIHSPNDRWLPQNGVWREFSARFTVLKSEGCSPLPVKQHYCSIFQAKGNNVDHWSVMLRVHGDGSLWFYPRRGNIVMIDEDILGKPFDMKVRDNGFNYEMYINGETVGTGEFLRTQEIGFRWGIYVGESIVAGDILVLVTGVTMK